MADICNRPGCSGKIVDGVCEDCGRAPLGTGHMVDSAAAGAAAGASARAAGTSRGSSASAVSSSSSLSGRSSSHRSTHVSQRSSRRTLGAGLVVLQPLATMDPLQALMADPVVPENKRHCPNCDAKLGHEKGFCPNCGAEYSFKPTLKAGDVIAGQYEVKGAIAYGGLGWIYLGWDTQLARWVVLKGLLNSKDAAGAAMAVAERQFLAAVKHPNIVGVYNFVSQGQEGYIVMEYVGGKTLKTIRKERGPLPAPEAIAYIHRILGAFAYLERMNLIYCDFKPDNFMVEEDDVKLIDMGGVRRADDLDSDIYGTKGYSAPEGGQSPSFVSDLYTVARTLAVLMIDFNFQGACEFSLPTPQEQPLFAQYDSLYRLLVKATRQDPDDRFQTADEMADQLMGVLREITATPESPRTFESTIFYGDSQEIGDPVSFHALPALKLDPLDPASGAILSAGGMTDLVRRGALFEKACMQFPDSVEAPLRLADNLVRQAAFDAAETRLAAVHEKDPFEWRVTWYRAVSLLAQRKAKEAADLFNQVYSELPGELAPKLALAIASEMGRDLKTAIRFYDIVSRTDSSFTSADFGLARCLAATGDRAGAVAAYQRVPQTSSRYVEAQMALARTLLQSLPHAPGLPELTQASATLTALTLDGLELHSISAELLRIAVGQVEAQAVAATAGAQLLGQPVEARSLRLGLERELRSCAHYAKSIDEKISLIDQANSARPRTIT
jgi:serine/threonine-protein kinase PknG